MCGIGRIHIGLKVVFSYSHATPSRGPNNAVLFTTQGEKSWEISKCLLNMFCRECAYNDVSSLGCVLYVIYDAWGCICSTDLFKFMGARLCICNLSIIIIKSDVSTPLIVVTCFSCCVSKVAVPSCLSVLV